MSALKSVLLAIDVATRKRDLAGKNLVQAQQVYLAAQDQLAQLESYAADTDLRWTATAQICATPELMRHHYQFMGRLQHAIGMQSGVIEDLNRQMEGVKKLLLEAECRLSSLKQVLKKKQADLAILQARREQKQMDEFAALQYGKTAARHYSGELS